MADILKVKSTMDYPSSSTYSAQISKDLATATADASLSENAIVFNDVTFEYNKAGAPSLSHISFSVKKGQTVGIIGGTGSGKTTLVNLISRFYDASKGTVLLDGLNIKITPEVISAPESALFPRRQLFSKALSGTI